MEPTQIKEHMEVVGSDGEHVGTVDSIEGGNQIKLTRNDPSAGGVHHWLDFNDIERVDDKVYLKQPAVQANLRTSGAAVY